MNKRNKERLTTCAWSAPSMILISLMVVFPILYTFYISLTNMNVYHWFDFSLHGRCSPSTPVFSLRCWPRFCGRWSI